jgi:hypothetical protein
VRVRWILLVVVVALAAVALLTDTSKDDPSARTSSRGAPEIDCTRYLFPETDVSKAITGARPGAILCLKAGTYGPIELTEVEKSPPVTVSSAPGERAVLGSVQLNAVSGLRFVALNLVEGATVTPSGSDLRFIDNDVTGEHGIYMFGDYRIDDRIKNVRIEGNTIHDIDYTGTQGAGAGYGIEGVGDVRGVRIRGNTIKSTASDYLQAASPVNWVVDHNTFLGPSLLADHEDHQDLWQIFGGGRNITFADNVARDTETQESLLFQEGEFKNVRVKNNLFDHDSRGYTCQIYQSDGLVFRHNTIVGSRWGCLFRDLASAPPGSRYRVERNIFVKTHEAADIATEGRARSWGTYDFNVSSDSSAKGPHSKRRWSPRWARNSEFAPLGLPISAGYEAP